MDNEFIRILNLDPSHSLNCLDAKACSAEAAIQTSFITANLMSRVKR